MLKLVVTLDDVYMHFINVITCLWHFQLLQNKENSFFHLHCMSHSMFVLQRLAYDSEQPLSQFNSSFNTSHANDEFDLVQYALDNDYSPESRVFSDLFPECPQPIGTLQSANTMQVAIFYLLFYLVYILLTSIHLPFHESKNPIRCKASIPKLISTVAQPCTTLILFPTRYCIVNSSSSMSHFYSSYP